MKIHRLFASVGLAAGLVFSLSSPAQAQLANTECTSFDVNNSTRSQVPFRTAKFRNVLRNSLRLQWPVQSNACFDSEDLGKFVNGVARGSYLQDRFLIREGRLIFNLPNTGVWENNPATTTRMELRGENFRSGNSGSAGRYKTWRGSFRFPLYQEPGHATRFAVGQLYSSVSDVIGILFERNLNDRTKARLVASPKLCGTSNCPNSPGIVLTQITNPYTVHDVRLVYDRNNYSANVYYNDEFKGNIDLGNYRAPNPTMYFKAGIYLLREPGTARVDFEQLDYSGGD